METQNPLHIIDEIQRLLGRLRLSVQSMSDETYPDQPMVSAMLSQRIDRSTACFDHCSELIAVGNGKVLQSEKFQELRQNGYETYDVVLNIANNELLARHDPKNKSPLQKCPCQNIGPREIHILQFMLEHPKFTLGVGNIDKIDQDFASIRHNALAKIIFKLRQALQKGNKDGPYLQTIVCLNPMTSSTGKAYKMNERWSCIVIKPI